MRWTEDPPFSQRRADGEIEGLSVDSTREALRRMGCSARLVEMPWARALTELEAGRLDVLPGTLRLPERERFAHFSAPSPQSRNLLFVHDDARRGWSIAKLADLRGRDFRLGVQIGVNYGPEYQALMQDPDFAKTVHRVSSRRILWRMVEAGRLDGVLANEMTGRQEIRQMGLQDSIRSSGVFLSHSGAAVAFSKKSIDAGFVARYNKAAESMLQDGTLAAIWHKYGATP